MADEPTWTGEDEDGFVDLTFAIRSVSRTDDAYEMRLGAQFEDRSLGVGLHLVRGILPGLVVVDGEMQALGSRFYRGGARLFSTGAESDRMVQAIAHFYGLPRPPAGMVESESFNLFALHQGPLDDLEARPIDPESERLHAKIFAKDRPDDPAEDYYESHLNVDLDEGLVFWNEKDPDYRKSLLRAIAAQA